MEKERRPVVIGIAGGSSSGKTMTSQMIYHKLRDKSILVMHEDSYYKEQSNKSMAQRMKTNYDHPLAFDNQLMYHQLVQLIHRHSIDEPIYDYKAHNRSKKTKHQTPKDIIIVEGILVLYNAKIRNLMDIKTYIDTDDDIRLIRRLRRDKLNRGLTLKQIIHQYLATVRPMFHQFIEPTKRYADIIIPGGGHNSVAIDLLVTKINSILHELKVYRANQ